MENISEKKKINLERMTIDAFVPTSTVLCLYKYKPDKRTDKLTLS